MENTDNNQNHIVKHIEGLSPDMIQEVIDFIDFLKARKPKKMSSNAAELLLQEESLHRIWDTETEDLYEL